MKQKSLGFNAFINGLKTVVSIIFPLITYPYVSKILGVMELGKYNFAYSVINYFYLFSALGFSTYAIREGAKYKNVRDDISEFSSEILSMNLVSTLISYLVLFLFIAFIPSLNPYNALLLVFSVNMVFTTFGCEWLFMIYEEYPFIALRSVIMQVVSLALLFILVKTPNDVLMYALVTVIAASGNNIFNILKLKNYVTLKIKFKFDWKRHLIPILILFTNTLAINLYVSSDLTILGILKSDYEVGIYSVSTKIYSVVKNLLSAIIVVSIPRLAYLWNTNLKEEFYSLTNTIINVLILVSFPAVTGLFCLSEEVIRVISSPEFLSANTSLRILSIALICCLFNWFFSSCILVPCKQEKYVVRSTVLAAVTNILFNFILIPFFSENAAAFTTLLAEGLSMCVTYHYAKNIIKIDFDFSNITTVLVGCVFIYAYCTLLRLAHLSFIGYFLLSILGSMIGFGVILLLLRNKYVFVLLDQVKNKVKK